MNNRDLDSTLRQLAGHLVIETREQERNFDLLYRALSEAPPDEASFAAASDFSIGRADLFFDKTIPTQRRDALGNLAARLGETSEEPHHRLFVREVPIRDPLLHASVPGWAAGARVDRSLGPFDHKDGRRFWFDFYPIARLAALYVQGVAEPLLLFKTGDPRTRLGPSKSPGRYRASYDLGPGSIWILGRVLALATPQDLYVGLAIDGGRVQLSTKPVAQNGALTVPPSSTIAVELDLAQVSASDSADKSAYGIDARNATVDMPQNLAFHFSGQNMTVDEVGNAAWELFDQSLTFDWDAEEAPSYDPALGRIVFPFQPSESRIEVRRCESRFHSIAGAAAIQRAGWALPVAAIDVQNPPEAEGTGAMLVQNGDGITDRWAGLEGGPFRLSQPAFLVSAGLVLISDTTGGNPHTSQTLELWTDELNPFGSKVEIRFPFAAKYHYTSSVAGAETFMTFGDTDFRLDRPVQVNGEPPRVRSRNSLLLVAASDTGRLIYLFDDNLLQDFSTNPTDTMALALTNALFKVSQVNGCLLFGSLSPEYDTVERGLLFLTFGLHAYLPTLPDPYAANLGTLRRQIRGRSLRAGTATAAGAFVAWLVARIRWSPPADENEPDKVKVSFHFAPLGDQFAGISLDKTNGGAEVPATPSGGGAVESAITTRMVSGRREQLPPYEEYWERVTGQVSRNLFALLDVSTNADLMGVSFNILQGRTTTAITTHTPVATEFPLQVESMDVVSAGRNVKAFTVPQISWEPLLNLTERKVSGDPPAGPIYYPNDGGPTQILNNSDDTVVLAPLPVTSHLLRGFAEDPQTFAAYALMTLPFGMKALAVLADRYSQTRGGTELLLNSEEFTDHVANDVKGGLQLQVNAGEAAIKGESRTFMGSTLQLNNVLDFAGQSNGDSTLGRTVTIIFNNEFLLAPTINPVRERGVPLERIDLSGYGASTFSNWLNPTAAFASTSQARFDVFVGRCAHEIIQVKSIIYPWGIKVVRTITMFRVGSGYVYRHDSGWRAESSGEFDFRYFVNFDPDNKVEQPSPFHIHPGVIRGLFNVQNIVETEEIAVVDGTMVSPKIVDDAGLYVDNPDPADALAFQLQPVYFDADIEIDNVVAGFATKKIGGVDRNVVPSKKILGYVQVAPRGIPITNATLGNLVLQQQGSIGGPIDCVTDLAGAGQKMRLNRFDFNNSVSANGLDLVFAVAGRGNVLLPKDGSWSMVKHERDTGEVTPVPPNLSVPVIRVGRLVKDGDGQKLDTPVQDVLLRIANPSGLLRAPGAGTLNYGFLQSTDTQKALFLTPAFQHGQTKMFSKTAPLFVDAFRIVNSKAVFPNVGNAENNIGDAISLVPNGTEFGTGTLQDAGAAVWRLMDITEAADNAAEAGFKLLKQIPTFDLPGVEFELIDTGDGNFRIYIEYEQKDDGGATQATGALDFDIDSTAADVAKTWKSRMENIALVVDLAGINRLMTIRGAWDSKKGSAAAYPQPELKFAKELKPVIEILQILQQLQGADYAGAVASGLKLAMSNKAGTWEYKFEASKEIPVLRFPVPDLLYNDPNAPFKLEAGLSLGAYFNAALNVTTDANKLLPSAGSHLGFYGRLSVMCVSLSVATVYAIGQVNLEIAADTKAGPSLRMKFGFGAQIVVGLPVAGNVSVLFVVGVEIFAASGVVEVGAFMLYEGHAEILGGLVGITIRIEAKGTVSRKAIGAGSRTDLACQVTFGLDISIFLVINISFQTSWSEQRQIA
jgi:hypothetical protein